VYGRRPAQGSARARRSARIDVADALGRFQLLLIAKTARGRRLALALRRGL